MTPADDAGPVAPGAPAREVGAFLRRLAQDLRTLAVMLQGPETVLSDRQSLPTRTVAADIAGRTAAAVDAYAARLERPAPDLDEALAWRDIASAADVREALVAGRYASGRWYVTKGVRDRSGGWSGLNAMPPSHWMPLPKPPG